MTAVACALPPLHDLPSLIGRAQQCFSGAKGAVEVFEVDEAAGLAYDVAKSRRSATHQSSP